MRFDCVDISVVIGCKHHCAVQGLRSHPLGPEVELSSFSGNSSVAVASSLPSSEAPGLLTPLPEQLESADSAGSEQALNQWSNSPQGRRRARHVREYEMAVMDNPDTMPQLPDSMPASTSTGRQSTDPRSSSPVFHASSSGHNTSDDQALLNQRLPSQEAALNDAFPSIRKITPTGSPEDVESPLQGSYPHAGSLDQVCHMLLVLCHECLPTRTATALQRLWHSFELHDIPCTSLCPLDHPTDHLSLPLQHASSSQPSSLSGTDSHQHEETPTTSHAAPDLHRTSAARLARLNTVSRQASPTHPQHSALPSHNGHIADEHAHRRSNSQSASTSNAASSALSQLLQSDTQASTGTPMARDLTEALTALASNKRLLSSMQASRSFSSPDLLSLAQQLHDSGQWPAVQDMVQQEEDEWSHDRAQAQTGSGHANYGTVVGRPHMGSVHDQGQTLSILPVCQHTCFKKCAASFSCFLQCCGWDTL